MLCGCATGLLIQRIAGAETANIAFAEALPASLPPLSAPVITLENIRLLAPAALATTLFALTEAVSIARSLADKTGQDLDGNQEFIGQGLSNIVGSFFSGYVATGSFNRSGLNFQAGAKTPLSAIIAGLALIVIVILVAPLTAYLPLSVMAGILLLVAWGLIDVVHIRKILQASTYESLILIRPQSPPSFSNSNSRSSSVSCCRWSSTSTGPPTPTSVSGCRTRGCRPARSPPTPACRNAAVQIVRIDGSLLFRGGSAMSARSCRRCCGKIPARFTC